MITGGTGEQKRSVKGHRGKTSEMGLIEPEDMSLGSLIVTDAS